MYEEIVKINIKLLHSKTYKFDYIVFFTISLQNQLLYFVTKVDFTCLHQITTGKS